MEEEKYTHGLNNPDLIEEKDGKIRINYIKKSGMSKEKFDKLKDIKSESKLTKKDFQKKLKVIGKPKFRKSKLNIKNKSELYKLPANTDIYSDEQSQSDNNYTIEKEQLINKLNIPLDDYNSAQRLHNREWITPYGKVANKQTSNTRLAYKISRLPQHNFGSIADYNIDTLPNSYLSRNGIEKFELSQTNKYYNGMSIISRRFACNILSTWAYVIGISYKNAIKIWAKDIPQTLPNGKIKDYKMLSGEECIYMIKDLLFLIRNKSPEKILKYAQSGIISEQLFTRINGIISDSLWNKKEKYARIMQIKDRLYINQQSLDKVWAYPKYSVEYLISTIKLLQSGKYFTEIYVPIINNLFKYPIECKDTHTKQLTDIEHRKARDDYDIGQYIWEDY